MSHIIPLTVKSTIVPARLADRVDELCKLLGQIGCKEADVKADESAILKLALNAGDHLIAIKAAVGHGKFGAWVKANVTCTARTATKYMRLAGGRILIEGQIGTGSDLSIRGALKLLRPPKAPPEPKPPATPATLDDLWGKATRDGKRAVLATVPARDLLELLPQETISELNAMFRKPYERAHPRSQPKPYLTLTHALAAPVAPNTKIDDAGDLDIPAFLRREPTVPTKH